MTANNRITRRGVLGTVAAGAGLMAAAASGELTTRARAIAAEDLRAGARRLARRLVLAARLRPPGEEGPQGVFADAHRRRRPLASAEQGHQSRHPHHRHRQPVQMGGPQGRLPGGAFLRRLAGLGRARTDRRSRLVDRLARRLQAGERPEAASTMPPSSAARRSRKRSPRANPAARRRRPRRSRSIRKDRAWVDSKTTPQPNGVAVQPIKLTGAREKVAKKTYIRASAYPQPAFDKALAECKADKTWKTFEAPSDCGHDVMVDSPQWLVERVIEVS